MNIGRVGIAHFDNNLTTTHETKLVGALPNSTPAGIQKPRRRSGRHRDMAATKLAGSGLRSVLRC
jgi:hypothetical protein